MEWYPQKKRTYTRHPVNECPVCKNTGLVTDRKTGKVRACALLLGINIRKIKKPKPCEKYGATFIDADHAVTNCGDTILLKRYSPKI